MNATPSLFGAHLPGVMYATLDTKARLRVPDYFRKPLFGADHAILTTGPRNSVLILPESVTRALPLALQPFAHPAEFNSAGRVMVPEALRRWGQLHAGAEVAVCQSGGGVLAVRAEWYDPAHAQAVELFWADYLSRVSARTLRGVR